MSAYCTVGWYRTRSGRKLFSNTKLAPKQVFAIIANTAARIYSFGTTGRKSMVAVDPMNAKDIRKVLRKRPWSAAPEMDIMRRAWSSTLREKVYIAKLAVLMSRPRSVMMHCPLLGEGLVVHIELEGGVVSKLEWHGVVRSERRTPFSRASCSRVTGMKEPGGVGYGA